MLLSTMDLEPGIIKLEEDIKKENENEKDEVIVKVEPDYVDIASSFYDKSYHDRCKNEKEQCCVINTPAEAHIKNENHMAIVKVKTENVDTEAKISMDDFDANALKERGLDVRDDDQADQDATINSAIEGSIVIENPGSRDKITTSGMSTTESVIDFHFLSGFGLDCSQTNKEILSCNFCTYTTRNKSTLRNHVLIHHKEPKEWYKCTSCSYETHVRSNLTKHVTAMHTSNYTKYSCVRCNKVFKEKKALDDHIVKSYPALISLVLSKIHSCPICTFKTTYKNNLSQHMLIHTKDNAAAYKCTNCDYTTYRKSDVMKHLKIHSKVKEFRCTGCNKEFGRKDHLDEHIIRHHSDNDQLTKSVNKKISICKHCDYRTTKLTSLTKHEKSHHS